MNDVGVVFVAVLRSVVLLTIAVRQDAGFQTITITFWILQVWKINGIEPAARNRRVVRMCLCLCCNAGDDLEHYRTFSVVGWIDLSAMPYN